MKVMKIKSIQAAVLVILLSLTGCAKWLDIKPSNEQTNDSFWQDKDEVKAVTMSGYISLRQALHQMIVWGDLRSNEIELGPVYTGSTDMIALKELEVNPLTTMDFLDWVSFYATIARANSVIKYGPDVLRVDDTFLPEDCDALIAEAKWIRALSYFYLVRAFRDVPFITDPYLDDSDDFRIGKTDGYEILKFLIDDLTEPDKFSGAIAMEALPLAHSVAGDGDYAWQNIGRATQLSCRALLADIYLWIGEYQKAYDECMYIETTGLYTLIPWYMRSDLGTIYQNTPEEIFSLQWSATYSQGNSMKQWFTGDNKNRRYQCSQEVINAFAKTVNNGDIRGANSAYNPTNSNIFRYRTDNCNWMIYRLADIMLMRAEASVMLRETGPYNEAWEIVKTIRTRAHENPALLTDKDNQPKLPTTQYEAITMILDERLLELCFEGKRWFDLVRVATRDEGKYEDIIINMMISNVPTTKREMYAFKLRDNSPWGFYFPIKDSEIEASGGRLEQNPYYL